RTWHYEKTNFHWDVANYYSYLPATFCNNGSYDFKNGTENYLPISPTGKRMSKVTYGMSVFYAPAFALGYKIAFNSNEKLDGFSEPFATCVHWISILYGLIGLIFLRKFLLKFFSEIVTAITLMIVFGGTMLFYYTMSNNEMTHTYLFFLISAFLLVTYKWHEKVTYKKTILIGLIIGFISLIRPSEILIFLIFIFWNVRSWKDFKSEAGFFFKQWPHLLIIFIIGVLIWLPQFFYWKEMTGDYLYSPYAGGGERFFWGDPQIINILFSYRKGWFVYTPLILLAFIGFFFMKGEVKKLRGILITLLCINIYVLSCWWDWFFGGCFGARGFCQHIAFLAIPIAACVDFFMNKENKSIMFQLTKLVFFVFVFSGISLNIGQTYQYNKNYIHSNSMSKKMYWKVFGEYDIDGDHFWRYWQSLEIPDYGKLQSGEDRDQ
ncbi:MAG: hypothetical protein ABIP51_21585, partial [Bacteroidia bacterium]